MVVYYLESIDAIFDMDSGYKSANRILEFAGQHPYVLLAVILVLVIMIIVMYLTSRGYGFGSVGKKCRKKKKELLNDEEELDDLIDSIHSKQKKKPSVE